MPLCTKSLAISANCAVGAAYGLQFFLAPGFTIEQNREADGKCQDEVLVKLRLKHESKDDFLVSRMKFVRSFLDVRVSMNHEDVGTQEALRYSRVAVATEMELRLLNSGATNMKAISPQNESRALAFLASVMRDKLQMYPTTLAEDDAVLRSNELLAFSDHRHALIVIISEKRVAAFYGRLAEFMCPILASPRHHRLDAIRRAADDLDLFRFANAVHRQLNTRH